jgi:predicted nucleic acid-binding protein
VILDTNAISAMAEDDRNILPVLRANPQIRVPVIALGEYRHGVLGSRRRVELEEWLSALLAVTPVLAVVEATSLHYAAIARELRSVGRPIPINDIWIASLARQHGLPILSRDGHFDEIQGIRRIDW